MRQELEKFITRVMDSVDDAGELRNRDSVYYASRCVYAAFRYADAIVLHPVEAVKALFMIGDYRKSLDRVLQVPGIPREQDPLRRQIIVHPILRQ